MPDDIRAFREARDAVELSLGGAFANIQEARERLDVLASAVHDRSEVDGLRGAVEVIAYAIEGLALAVGHLGPTGTRDDGSSR
jgi:hypothetical protein